MAYCLLRQDAVQMSDVGTSYRSEQKWELGGREALKRTKSHTHLW